MAKTIVMLTGKGKSSRILYHALSEDFHIEKIIQEEGVDRKKFLKRRAKRLGYWRVFGQILFQGALVPLLKKTSKKRADEIMAKYRLNDHSIDKNAIKEVTSVNAQTCMELLQNLKPDIVIVNGTRIISKKILNCVDATFINTHAGITPRYRGVHGGYWALANNDKDHCGVSVHLVDAGIDTGGVLYQKNIEPTPHDNFSTYPLLQLAEGISLMKKAIKDVMAKQVKEVHPDLDSKLWSHPTIWSYMWKRIMRGVK